MEVSIDSLVPRGALADRAFDRPSGIGFLDTIRADADIAANPLSKRVATVIDLDAMSGLIHLELPDPSSSAPLQSAPPTTTSFSFFGSSPRKPPQPRLAPAVQVRRHSLDPESLRGPSLESHRSSCDAQWGSEASSSSPSCFSGEVEISSASEVSEEGPSTPGRLPGGDTPRILIEIAGERAFDERLSPLAKSTPFIVHTPPSPSTPPSDGSGTHTPLASVRLHSPFGSLSTPPLHSLPLPPLSPSFAPRSSNDIPQISRKSSSNSVDVVDHSFSRDMDDLHWEADAASKSPSIHTPRRSGFFGRGSKKAEKELRREAEQKLGARVLRAAGAEEAEVRLRAASVGYAMVNKQAKEAKEVKKREKEERVARTAREESERAGGGVGGVMLGGHFALH